MLLIDQYAYINQLKKVHPAEKMAFTFSLLLFSLIVRDELISLITFCVMSAFIIYIAKIPWHYYAKLLLLPSVFLLTSLLPLLFSIATVGASLPPHYMAINVFHFVIWVSYTSVHHAIQLVFIVLGSISCLYFLILTTSVQAICHILRKLHVPVLFVEMCELVYRFIFIFLQSTEQIYIAQQSRLGYHSPVIWLRSISLLVSSLVVDMLQRSTKLSYAMQSRSLDANPMYWEDAHHISIKNWLIIMTIFSIHVIIYITKEVLR